MIETGKIERNGDEAAVRFERVINAAMEIVWRALTRPEHLAAWLAESEFDPVVGGKVAINFGEGEAVTGKVTTFEPPTLLEYTWNTQGEDESLLRIELSSAGEATRLVLEHVRLPGSIASGYGAGWHAHLDRLVDHLSGNPVRDWGQRFAELLPSYRD